MQEEMQEKLDKMEVMRKEMTSMLGKDVGQMGEMRMKVDGLEMKVDGLEKEVVDLKGELAQANAEKAAHSERCDARIDELEGQLKQINETKGRVDALENDAKERRQMQGAEPEPEPEPIMGDNVKMIKRDVVRCGGPGGTTADGIFDYSQCADHAFAQCHLEACNGHGGGHRRAQSGICSPSDITSRSTEIQSRCCDEPDEDCTSGYPHTCNAGCAAVFLPFWLDCRSALGKDSRQFEPTVALCEAAAPAGDSGTSLAEQLNVQCTDDSLSASDCIPDCTPELHGYILLLNLDGDDTTLSCNLAHGLYSWMGAASEGGYLGADFASFFSAVVSGAAGIYIVTLTEDAGISTDLVIQPGQDVHISGDPGLVDPPSWGSGGFTVGERASLTLTHVRLSDSATGRLTDSATGQLSDWSPAMTALTTTDGGSLSLSLMTVPAYVLGRAQAQLSGAGSRLRLSAVTLPEYPALGELTGTMTVGDSITIDPPFFGTPVTGTFAVTSGPCEVSGGGRCVGRPGGFNVNERCNIVVGGGGGVLGPCAVFDMQLVDYIEMPVSNDWFDFSGSDCPVGVALAHGDDLEWESGSVADREEEEEDSVSEDNGCADKGTCGLPYRRGSGAGFRGGWVICFA